MIDKEKIWKVYRYWINLDGEEWSYVGQSSADYRSVRAGNLKTGIGYCNQPKFWAAIQKYGFENFNYEVIWKTTDPKEADDLEKMTIDILNSVEHGFNENYGRDNSVLTRRKISKASGCAGVLKYDLQGNFIEAYNTLAEAAEKNHVWRPNISKCLVGQLKSTGGYKWAKKSY